MKALGARLLLLFSFKSAALAARPLLLLLFRARAHTERAARAGSTWPNAAAAAYYNSVAKQLNDWGVDFVKADCMFPGTPYPPLVRPAVKKPPPAACLRRRGTATDWNSSSPCRPRAQLPPNGYFDDDLFGITGAFQGAAPLACRPAPR